MSKTIEQKIAEGKLVPHWLVLIENEMLRATCLFNMPIQCENITVYSLREALDKCSELSDTAEGRAYYKDFKEAHQKIVMENTKKKLSELSDEHVLQFGLELGIIDQVDVENDKQYWIDYTRKHYLTEGAPNDYLKNMLRGAKAVDLIRSLGYHIENQYASSSPDKGEVEKIAKIALSKIEHWQDIQQDLDDSDVGLTVYQFARKALNRIKEIEEFASQSALSLGQGDKEGWVSVEERLPEEMQQGLYLWDGYTTYSGFYTEGKFLRYSGHSEVLITHWMPLPQPPKQ